MSSQPPYGSYPPQSQPPEGSYPGYEQASAYPPPPPYGATGYPPQQGQPPMPPPYGAPQIYVQPSAYPYMVAAPVAPPDPGSGQAVTSLILGIVSIVFAFIPCLGFISLVTGVVGLIMGILGRKSTTQHSMAITGIVLSAISLGLVLLFTALWVGLNVLTFALPTN